MIEVDAFHGTYTIFYIISWQDVHTFSMMERQVLNFLQNYHLDFMMH